LAGFGERIGGSSDVLKTNFSVGVSMYSEKVTSYWYFFFCTHLAKSVGCESRKASAETEKRPMRV
jgi:hypothetical protein